MVKEVLDTMIGLARDGMTMICVPHEMGFARQVNPKHQRTRAFLGEILAHH